jgi:hypothetical protein
MYGADDSGTSFEFSDIMTEGKLASAEGPLVVKQEPFDFSQSGVKQEPIDFPLGGQRETPGCIDPVPVDMFANLSEEQRLIMTQLLFSISASTLQRQTVEPSMLQLPLSDPSTSHISPSHSVSVTSEALQPILEHQESSHETLHSVLPHEAVAAAVPIPLAGSSRSERQASTFSSLGDDLEYKLDQLMPLPAIFGSGKGKGGKKGGGMSSVVRGSDEELDDDDSWRPSPEEYKKLSSKEKRQLRNKLSARAFRTRRKDYIGTLEGHIKDRDHVIDAIKSELTTSRTENMDLRWVDASYIVDVNETDDLPEKSSMRSRPAR